jgi:hypothetical protein
MYLLGHLPGAGTTDLVVLYKRQVLAAHGNNWLGGSDVDMLLLNCVPDHLLQGANANLLVGGCSPDMALTQRARALACMQSVVMPLQVCRASMQLSRCAPW